MRALGIVVILGLSPSSAAGVLRTTDKLSPTDILARRCQVCRADPFGEGESDILDYEGIF